MNKERVKKNCVTLVGVSFANASGAWVNGKSAWAAAAGLDYSMQTWKSRLGFMEIMISFEFDIIPWENIGDSAPTRVHDEKSRWNTYIFFLEN